MLLNLFDEHLQVIRRHPCNPCIARISPPYTVLLHYLGYEIISDHDKVNIPCTVWVVDFDSTTEGVGEGDHGGKVGQKYFQKSSLNTCVVS